MNRYKITVIAAVSSLFIGFNVGLLVKNSPLSGFYILMGIAAGIGSMMIELTVPESLINIWSRSGWNEIGIVYKILAVIATIATPILLIYALPSDNIARFSVAFIAAALISYVMFYSNEFSKAQTMEDSAAAQDEKEYQRKKELMELEHKLQLDNDLALKREDTRKEVKLAQVTSGPNVEATPEAIYTYIKDNPGISFNKTGIAFNIDPQTAKKRYLIEQEKRLEIAQNGK